MFRRLGRIKSEYTYPLGRLVISTRMGSGLHTQDFQLTPPLPYWEDARANQKEYAQALDDCDPLKSFRDQFIIPSKKDLKRKLLAVPEGWSSPDSLFSRNKPH